MKKQIAMCLSFISFLGLSLFSTPVFAGELSEVDVFMKDKLSTVMKVLGNKNLTKTQRDEKILVQIDAAFDFKRMAKLSLGKKYWPGLSKEEKARFSSLFIKAMKDSYLEKLDLYTDEEVVYSAPIRVKKKVHFMTDLVSGGNSISILYKLYQSKKLGWRVYDIELEGVSLIATYRSQFYEVLDKGSMNDLFEKLK